MSPCLFDCLLFPLVAGNIYNEMTPRGAADTARFERTEVDILQARNRTASLAHRPFFARCPSLSRIRELSCRGISQKIVMQRAQLSSSIFCMTVMLRGLKGWSLDKDEMIRSGLNCSVMNIFLSFHGLFTVSCPCAV